MIVNQIVDAAMQKAQDAQALIVQKETSEVAFENDVLKSAESSQSTEIKVKTVVNGKIGVSTTTDLDDINGVVNRTIELTAFGQECTYRFPGFRPCTDVKVYDENLSQLSKPDMIQLGYDMQHVIKAYDPHLTFRGSITKRVTTKTFANSTGAHYTEHSTYIMLWCLGLRIRETGVFETWHGDVSRRLDIEHIVIADRAVEMMRYAEANAPMVSGKTTVIFAPAAMDVILLPLRLGLDGKHILTGYSSLGSQLDQRIVNETFNLTDHPLLDYASNSSSYDDEGIPRRVLPLIEKGMVKNFLYDLESANRAGRESTGHGERRDTTNLLIEPGKTSLSDMVKNIQNGLIVYYVMGLGQGNPVSGDFSVGVRVGYKIDRGEIVGLVHDAMLAGNVFDALNNIVAISREAENGLGWYPGHYPYIQVDGLSLAVG